MKDVTIIGDMQSYGIGLVGYYDVEGNKIELWRIDAKFQ
jgi:limonene-1,2-epoxide hydrolase